MRLWLCVALLTIASGAPVPSSDDDCTFYRKVSGTECADGCFADKVGVCPFSVIKAAAGLDEGKCADTGYTIPDGSTDQKAGPCGTLTFNKYKSEVENVQMDRSSGPCCKGSCPAGSVKYFSVDVKHGFCGETCISNWTYSIFKVFEPNLTLAIDDTPCPEQFTPWGTHYTNYSSTVTHGVFPLRCTLDLYAPDPPQSGTIAAA